MSLKKGNLHQNFPLILVDRVRSVAGEARASNLKRRERGERVAASTARAPKSVALPSSDTVNSGWNISSPGSGTISLESIVKAARKGTRLRAMSDPNGKVFFFEDRSTISGSVMQGPDLVTIPHWKKVKWKGQSKCVWLYLHNKFDLSLLWAFGRPEKFHKFPRSGLWFGAHHLMENHYCWIWFLSKSEGSGQSHWVTDMNDNKTLLQASVDSNTCRQKAEISCKCKSRG